MEAKYLYRTCLILTAMAVVSVFTQNVHNENRIVHSQNKAHGTEYPLRTLLTNMKSSINDEIKRTFSPISARQNDDINSDMYRVASGDHLPSDVVYGLITNEDVWNVKVGPFADSSYVQDLSRYLLAHDYKITLKSDQAENGTEYNIFIRTSPNKEIANNTIAALASDYHVIGTLTKNYS
jgi:hypothetical protein